jgi:hypothetical protein
MSSDSFVRSVTTNLPSTLVKWRDYDTSPMIALWDHLRAWFSSQGLHIFEILGVTLVKPPANELRAHDGTYSTHYDPPKFVQEHRVPQHMSIPSVCADFVCRD